MRTAPNPDAVEHRVLAYEISERVAHLESTVDGMGEAEARALYAKLEDAGVMASLQRRDLTASGGWVELHSTIPSAIQGA